MAQKQSENSTFKKMNDSRVMMQTEETQQCLMQYILRQCIHGYNSIYDQHQQQTGLRLATFRLQVCETTMLGTSLLTDIMQSQSEA